MPIRVSLIRKLFSRVRINLEDVVISEIDHLLNSSEKTSLKVLDLGAGSGHYWDRIVANYRDTNFEITLVDAVQVESKLPLTQNVSFERVVSQVPLGLETFQNSTFDLVVAFDLIEHLTKDEGYILLYEMDRIASKSSIIFTPNGFVWQPPSTNNSFNAHISGWKATELRKLGWSQLRGHTGPKFARLPYGMTRPNFTIWPISELDAIGSLIVYRFYKFAFAFSATKKSKNIRVENQNF